MTIPARYAVSQRRRRALAAVCEAFLDGRGPAPAAAADSILEGLALARPHARRRLLLALSLVTASGFPGRSVERRADALARWRDSPIAPRRAAFEALRRLAMVHAYGLPSELWADLRYPGPVGPPAEPPAPGIAPLAVHGDTALDCDVCVVGSGAGGGVAAGVLAGAGLDVVVLEAGGAYGELDFDGDQIPGYHRLYLDGGVLSTEDQRVTLLAGACLGGGTVVNYTTSFRTPEAVRAEWGEPFTGEAFTRSLDAVCERLGVNTDHSRVPAREQPMRRGLERLGWHHDLVPRNVDCRCDQGTSCGYCGFGCRLGAKQSTTKTWLADAYAAGARMLVRTEARRVVVERGAARAVEAVTAGGDRVTVRARAVVAACGALRTPALLRRSRVDHPTVGANLRLHPVSGVGGVFADDVRPWEGTLQAVYSDELADLEDGYGAKLETAPIHPTTLASFVPWDSRREAAELMRTLPNLAAVAVLLRDRGSGEVRVGRDGEPRVHYRLAADDERRMRTAIEAAARVLEAAGAERTVTVWRGARSPLFSFHQMGSVRMGASRADTVCDPEGRVRGVDGLVVCDASTFPSASGVNPMVTIEAIAHLAASALAARLT